MISPFAMKFISHHHINHHSYELNIIIKWHYFHKSFTINLKSYHAIGNFKLRATTFEKELLLYCDDKFETERRMIKIQGKPSISLPPSVFRRMLRLPNPTLIFKNVKVDDFIKVHDRGM